MAPDALTVLRELAHEVHCHRLEYAGKKMYAKSRGLALAHELINKRITEIARLEREQAEASR